MFFFFKYRLHGIKCDITSTFIFFAMDNTKAIWSNKLKNMLSEGGERTNTGDNTAVRITDPAFDIDY